MDYSVVKLNNPNYAQKFAEFEELDFAAPAFEYVSGESDSISVSYSEILKLIEENPFPIIASNNID